MMRGRIVWVLLQKELLEVVRDRRSLFLMVVLPLVMYPVLFLVTTQMTMSQMEKLEAQRATVVIVGHAPPAPLAEILAKEDTLQIVTGRAEQAMALLTAHEVAAVFELPADLHSRIAATEPVTVVVHYDETDRVSVMTSERLRKVAKKWRDTIVDRRMVGEGLPVEITRPLTLEARNIAPPQKVGGYLLAQIVPMLIVMMIVLGAFYPAIEVTAGEKERGTLQTLLTAPIAPLEIVTGKFLSVFCVAVLTGAANIASIGLMFGMTQLVPEGATAKIDLGLSWTTIGLMGVIAVLIGLMFSAVMMTVAVLAKTFKEAQSYMTPVYLLCILPVIFAQLPGVTLEGILVYTPGINQTLLLKEVLEGTFDLQHLFVVSVTSLIYTIGTLIVAARIFEHEAILLGEAGIAGLFTPEEARWRARALPRPGEALALVAITFILLFYGGSIAQSWHLLGGLAVTQWLLILTPALIFIRMKRFDLRATLGLRRPPAMAVGSAILFGLCSWYPMMLLSTWMQRRAGGAMSDAQRELLERLSEQLMGGGTPVVVLLLVIAASPAICEEVLFRGVLLRSLAGRVRTRTVVLVTALLFGAFHMSAIRFVPTASLGIVLALLAVRSGSLLPGILFHFLHNGIVVLLGRYQLEIAGVTAEASPRLAHALAAACGLAVATLLLLKATPPRGVSEAPHSSAESSAPVDP